MKNYPYVILGGGLASGYAAQEFVEKGINKGDLCIISAETTLPYERPPLSKDFLAGEEEKEDILINDPDFYNDHGINVKLDTRIDRVDLQQKKLFANGDAFGYDQLMIATGSRPRKLDLPGSELNNIFYLRRVGDAQRIRQAAQDARHAVVIGGGFIGMEAASVLRGLDLETTLIFPEHHVWDKIFDKTISRFFENYFRGRQVILMPENEVVEFLGDGAVRHVKTSSGIEVPADLVVAGVGALPNTQLFRGSGLELADDGIVVNDCLQTNLPGVLAVGDVARYYDHIFDRPLRIEHWDNAVEQGRHAARVMLGDERPYKHVPYFFSDVFDLSYEFWGNTSEAAQIVHRGDISSGSFSSWWLDNDNCLVAAFVMDRPDEEREVAPEWIREKKHLDAHSLMNADSLNSITIG